MVSGTVSGATVCTTPAGVAERADIIFTMVPDTPDVEKVLFGADGVEQGLMVGNLMHATQAMGLGGHPFNGGKGRAEIGGVVFHRGTRRCTDKPRAIEGPDQDRIGTVAKACQIAPFIVPVAIVKVGPVAKHRDAQRRHIVQRSVKIRSRQAAHRHRHAETCATQSARL